jgi:putative ABC transport system permease protein
VALTQKALGRLGTELGRRVSLLDPARSVRVVGVVDEAGERDLEAVWAPPGSLLGPQGAAASGPPMLYLAGDRPVTWADVRRLNAAGTLVLSRAVVLAPPPRSRVPYFTQGYASDDGRQALALAIGVMLVVTLAGLEVVLLAGAAFAVGARRQARSLGLVTAAGGEPRHVRRIVLAGGVVLGLAGALAGLVLALGLAAAAMPLLERHAGAEFGHYDVRPLELAGAALVGLTTAVLAAVLPARTAARRDPVEALTGRRGQVRTRRRVPAAGLAVAGLGVATAALGSGIALSRTAGVHPAVGGSATVSAALIAGGAALTQIGLIICSPAIVGLAGRWARRLPLPLRLALTDASRHRGRSAPAVAAVLTAVTGATALALVVASFDDRDRANYKPLWPTGTAGVPLESFGAPVGGRPQRTRARPDRVVAAVRSELPPFAPLPVRAVPECADPKGACTTANLVLPRRNECPAWRTGEPNAAGRTATARDWRCESDRFYEGGGLPSTPVGDAELVRALAGRAPAAAGRMLDAGGIVVLDRRYVVDGRVGLEIFSQRTGRSRRVRLPATLLDVRSPPVLAVYGERAARRLGLRTAPTHLLLSFARLPTTEQEDAARAALRSAGIPASLAVERGYVSDYGLGLLALVVGAAVITLGAAGIATGLAQADARADHATLAAVGATPTLRRTLAAAQALAVAGLGTLLGVLAGLVPSLAFIGALDSLRLAVPWLTLVQVLVGIPLVAAACAWLFTRSRLPLERRVAA